MSRRLILLLFIMGALLSLGLQVFASDDQPTPARFVTVERRDVHQVKAITGVLSYADEQYVLAPASSVVSKLCVQAGQRVAVNEALVRLELPAQPFDFANLLQADISALSLNADERLRHELQSAHQTIRSQDDCTVRQVLIHEGSSTSLGSPLLRLSSNEQIIRCSVMHRDAQDIYPGQWAWIYANGEKLGTGSVVEVGEEELNAVTGFRERAITLAPMTHIDLSEGTAIEAEIFLAGSDQVLSLPVEAITERNTVWWVNQGRCTEIPAEIVLSDEMYAWVNLPEGLLVAIGEFEEGQQVVEASN